MLSEIKNPDGDLCAEEPIRIPGGIQPHGALLVLDLNLRMIQASANLFGFAGLAFEPGSDRWTRIAAGSALRQELARLAAAH